VSDGTVTSAPITVNFTITPVDDPDNAPPVGNTDAYTTAEDTTLTIPAPGLLTNDTDANGQQLLITDAIAPTHGTLAINPDGSFTYTPSLNYNGPDSFSYQVSDGIDKSASTTVNITVTPVNDAPVINNDTIPFPKNGFIGFSLQNRSSDVDNDTLTATLISGTTHGELFFDGVQRVFTYKPNTDYVGEDSFTYKVNDGTVDSPIATVTLNVS
jgi:VCBS repeat-containing protein